MTPHGLSIALAVAGCCAVGGVLLLVAWALCEELAHSAHSRSWAARRSQRGALVCLDGGGRVAAGQALERAAARRMRLRTGSRGDLARRGRLRLVVATSPAESPARPRRRRVGIRQRRTTDTVQQRAIGPVGLLI